MALVSMSAFGGGGGSQLWGRSGRSLMSLNPWFDDMSKGYVDGVDRLFRFAKNPGGLADPATKQALNNRHDVRLSGVVERSLSVTVTLCTRS